MLEYTPRDATLLPQIPALLLLHAQIRWSNWLAAQWGKTSEVPSPNLAGLWTAMDNQEPWETTFPAGYTFLPDTASLRLSQGPPTPARWNPLDIPTAPPRAAPTPPTPKAEAASRGGGRGGNTNLSGGGGGGGNGSGSAGEERPNYIAYNNAYVEDRWGDFRHAGGYAANHERGQRSGRRSPLVAPRPQV